MLVPPRPRAVRPRARPRSRATRTRTPSGVDERGARLRRSRVCLTSALQSPVTTSDSTSTHSASIPPISHPSNSILFAKGNLRHGLKTHLLHPTDPCTRPFDRDVTPVRLTPHRQRIAITIVSSDNSDGSSSRADMANDKKLSPEQEVRSWGFSQVFTWCDRPNAHYPPHTHRELTTHLITRGELTITYPEDETPTKETHGVGARIDVEANRVHEVWVGAEGCTYVIGE
ncbi:hypothetical protein B0T11DRAFT_284202 [Plectosphaerella cucumerina]|uniref:Uncharacterized protein n=1 Tax=Plectosphaerella cucumerina TaxID=40658 RepID=A0A8K0TH32_9PEZI|nr:hypothetical protein B0T11DRAFT_284202 [Plectosphaerella cucumerina]